MTTMLDVTSLDELLESFQRVTAGEPRSALHGIEVLQKLLDSFGRASGHPRPQEERPSIEELRATLGSFVSEGVLALLQERRATSVLGILGLKAAELHLSRGLAFLFEEGRTIGQLLMTAIWPRIQDGRARAGLSAIPGKIPTCRGSDLEVSGALSRIDIEVRCDDALIHFENKPFSQETGGNQTIRQMGDLRRRAEQLGIAPERAIGVYMTPGGSSASSAEFVSLSYLDLHDICISTLNLIPEASTERDVLKILASESRRVALGY